MRPNKTPDANATYDKAELLVVTRVHGLALLDAATVVGLTLRIKGNSPQLKDDVPLSLHMQRRILKCCLEIYPSLFPFTIFICK